MDLNPMSLTELRRLQNQIAAEIKKRSDVDRRALLKQFKKMAADKGLSLEELMAATGQTVKAPPATSTPKKTRRAPAAKAKKSPPKYWHPQDPNIGWSGHGRRPQWVLDWIAQGKPIEELAKR